MGNNELFWTYFTALKVAIAADFVSVKVIGD